LRRMPCHFRECLSKPSARDLAIKEGPGADELVRWRLSHAERRHKH
jgi:hypothetical protein